MKKLICAGNWKMFKTPSEAESFVKNFLTLVGPAERANFLVFPPAILAGTMRALLVNTGFNWGLQNSYFENNGAFTGENSAFVAKDMGATAILIGHSERRQLFGETDANLAKKVRHVQGLGLTPVLCVGETLAQREQELTAQVVTDQVRQGLEGADRNKPLWLAYEPVWAIGTGKVATPQQAQEAHALIRTQLTELGFKAKAVPLLYGGSVKPDNAKELGKQADVDGFLIGGASLEAQSFVQIYRNSL